MVMIHCCIILHQVNTLSSRLNMDYSCTSKYFLINQIENTTTKIIIKMLMVLDFKILSLWFVFEYWWYNTITRENNWFLNDFVKSNFATPTPFRSVSCFVVGICLFNYNLNSFLIHQAPYQKGYQWYIMHREVLGSIWKIGRYPIKVSEVLWVVEIVEPQHEISNNVVCATSKGSDQPAHTCSIRADWSEPLLVAWIFYDW